MAFRKKTLGLIERIVSTASSGGNLALANNSRTYQQITGILAHTVTLPQANAASPNECPVGLQFTVLNRSTGVVTVNYFGGSLAKSMAANTQATFRLVDNSTSAGVWDVTNEAAGSAGNSLTSEQKAATLAALGPSFYQDDKTSTVVLKINPEEIGGNYWKTKSVLTSNHVAGAGTTLNGYVYAISGANTAALGTTLTVNERYNDDDNYWLASTPVTTGLIESNAYTLNGFNYFVGLALHFQFNDSTLTWASKTALLQSEQSGASWSINGFGYFSHGTPGPFTTVNQVYSDVNNAWYLRAPGLTGIQEPAYFVLNKFVYVFTGTTGSPSNVNQIYDDASNAWRFGTVYPFSYDSMRGFAINGVGYGAGGRTTGGGTHAEVNEYSDVFGTWTLKSPLTIDRAYLNTSSLNGHGYVFGGEQNNATALTSTESFSGSSFFQVPITKKSKNAITALYVAAVINNVTGSVPARMRTDGDTWKYFEANKDTLLKVGESLSKKFLENGNLFVAGGDSADGVSIYNINEFYNPVANTWTARQAFSTGKRVFQSFKLLGYGHLIGGVTSGGMVATNDRYNEITDVWDTKASLPVGKTHGAGFNLKGFGYAIAGESGGIVLTNYQYDADLDSWSTKAPIPLAASDAAGYVLLGRGYVVNGSSTGSFGNNQNLNQQYDSSVNSWTAKTGSSNGRTGPGGFSINNNGYISGGFYAGSFAQSSTEKYNPVLDSWSTVASNSAGRTLLGGSTSGGFGYISGGQVSTTPFATVDKYNSDANTYIATASLGTARTGSSSNFNPSPYRDYELQIGLPSYLATVGALSWSVVPNMNVAKSGSASALLDGETHSWELVSSSTNLGEKFQSDLRSWLMLSTLVANVTSASHFTLFNNLYAVSGGISPAVNTAYKYDPSVKAWASIASVSQASNRHYGNGRALNGFGYKMGGFLDPGGVQTSVMERYSPSSNSWSTVASTPDAFTYGSGTGGSVGGFMYKIAGFQNGPNTFTNLVGRYNDANDSWSYVANYPTNIAVTASREHGDKIISVGGQLTLSTSTNAVYEYNYVSNIWTPKTNYPLSTVESAAWGGDIITGGFSGAVLSVAYKLTPAIQNIVLGAGLRIN